MIKKKKLILKVFEIIYLYMNTINSIIIKYISVVRLYNLIKQVDTNFFITKIVPKTK